MFFNLTCLFLSGDIYEKLKRPLWAGGWVWERGGCGGRRVLRSGKVLWVQEGERRQVGGRQRVRVATLQKGRFVNSVFGDLFQSAPQRRRDSVYKRGKMIYDPLPTHPGHSPPPRTLPNPPPPLLLSLTRFRDTTCKAKSIKWLADTHASLSEAATWQNWNRYLWPFI